MNDIYSLEVLNEYGEGEFEESCFLGLYSSKEKAREMIDFFRQKEEYKKYGRDCFIISKCYYDKKQWIEGFLNWEAMLKKNK